MSTRVWVLGDAVLIYYPKARGDYYSVLVGRLQCCSRYRKAGGEKCLYWQSWDDPFGRFMYQTLSTENVDTRICLLILNIAPQLWL